MSKKIGRKLRHLFHCVTLNDLAEDIDKKVIDFKKHITPLKVGHYFYRLVNKGDDPLLPTGKESRFVSEPYDFSFVEYRRALNLSNDWQAITLATGGAGMSLEPITPFKELNGIADTSNMDLYKLTLTSPLDVVDFEKLRKDLYIPLRHAKKRHSAYQLLYGQHINGLLFRSTKENIPPYSLHSREEYNLYIYTDWIKGYKQLFTKEKIGGQQRTNLLSPYYALSPLSVLTPIKPSSPPAQTQSL